MSNNTRWFITINGARRGLLRGYFSAQGARDAIEQRACNGDVWRLYKGDELWASGETRKAPPVYGQPNILNQQGA